MEPGNVQDWIEADVESPSPRTPYFERKVAEFGERLRTTSGGRSGYCAVTGIVATQFRAIYSFGDIGELEIEADIAAQVTWFEGLSTLPLRNFSEKWFIPLVGQNEFYGFYIIFSPIGGMPGPDILTEWDAILGELSGHNYTRRVQFLSEPFSSSNGDGALLSESATGRRLTHLTALSFGADGAVLRTYDPREEKLTVVDFEGEIPGELIAERRNGELLSGAVINDVDYGWSVVEIGETVSIRGCRISSAAVERLRALGVRAAITARLEDPRKTGRPPLGTLAYFFNRPNSFSWRDVTLFLERIDIQDSQEARCLIHGAPC